MTEILASDQSQKEDLAPEPVMFRHMCNFMHESNFAVLSGVPHHAYVLSTKHPNVL